MNGRQNLGASLGVGLLCLAFAAQAGDNSGNVSPKQNTGPSTPRGVEDLSEVKVHLRLIAIETASLYEGYDRAVRSERECQDNISYSIITNDLARMPEYQQRLNHYQASLAKTKGKLVELEVDKAKLTKRLGATKLGDSPDPTLERILERLNSIEKRLERIAR